jgi:hypothetical protein
MRPGYARGKRKDLGATEIAKSSGMAVPNLPVAGSRLERGVPAIPGLSFTAHFDHSQVTEGRSRRIPVLGGVHMPDSIEERLARIEAYLHKRYLYLKEKPRTSFEEMELLKEFGFDEPPKA